MSDEQPATGAEHDEGFSGTQTAKVVGISYRQLDYWARTDLIRPSLSDAAGSGSRARGDAYFACFESIYRGLWIETT